MKTRTEKARVGQLGEEIACRFLIQRDFKIEDRNYWKKWGEIDIIAQNKKILHFVEVKSVTYENLSKYGFSRVTEGAYRPEENVHPQKLARMRRVIQSYLLEKNLEEGEWRFDVLTVRLFLKDKVARCELLEDIVL